MKNLKLLLCKPTGEIPNCSNACMTIDVDTSTVYVVSPTHFVGFSPETGKVLVEVSLVSIGPGFVPENGDIIIIGVQHLPELEAVCFATDKGDVYLYNTTIEQFECVGSVESGLTCMSWSPDQEMVVFATGEDNIIIMNKDFDPITEVSMKSKLLDEDTPVNVGWGKKETQFHGSLGKDAAKPSKEVDSDLKTAEGDDDKPRISWRGDGQFFVVNSVSSQGVRELRVWNREGCLVSTDEGVSGLEPALDWRPSGNLIASTQRLPDKHQVVFFEKNGLRRGEFSLRYGQKRFKVIRLIWNIDSTVLAVWIEDVGDNATQDHPTFHNYVQLWHCSNYHWFLKQELDVSVLCPDDAISDVCWDSECSLKLHLLTKGGCYTSYRFCWEITQSPGHSSENRATVVMIDGAKLLLTPMASVVIPPPMSAHSCQTHSPINGVAFHPTGDSIALLLSDGSLVIAKSATQERGTGNNNTADNEPTAFLSMQRVKLKMNGELWIGPGGLQQLTWWKHSSLVAIGRNLKDGLNVLCEIQLIEHDGQYEASLSNILPVEKDILRLSANVDTGSLAVECTDGAMLRWKSESDQVEVVPWITKDGLSLVMPQPCIYVQTVEIGEEEVVIGLTEHSRLYMNEKEVANNCSSFFIHDEFLLLSTTAHVLRFMSILSNKKGLWSLLQGSEVEDNVRSVERGSKIITAVTRNTKVILQMPRGNLETIHPRVLVVSCLKKCLDSIRYKDAFVCMKRHRINFNLIYDHNPKLFLDNVETFIREVESVAFVNIFLSDLREEDVTLTLYLEHYRERSQVENPEKVCKVDSICNAMRIALEAVDRSKYLLCILTSHVRKTKPELETALTLVKHLKDSNDVSAANDALKYVLFLVDVNKMYDVALGMYDFQLVLMVAEKSQQDPKEYLPFLNNLRKMDNNYQKYSIDKYLKRYSKAINHLAKCGAERFEECLALIKEQSLYTEALPLYPPTSNEYKTVAECYAGYLMARKKHDEAGLVLSRCESNERALEAFQKSGNWRQVFCVAVKLALSQEKKINLSRSLAEYLREHDRHGEAAVVLLDYANDYEEAIESLIQGKLWEESLRLMYKFERTDIIETHLKPALQEACVEFLSSLEANRSQFEKYKNRLKVVREDKKKKQMDFMDNELHDDPDAELFSETSSMTGKSTITTSSLSSRTSRSTGKSSRNRKKAKRKKVSLKEGSPFEDFALMEALSEITLFVDKMQEEISILLKMLVLFGYDIDASDLQKSYGDMLLLVRSSLTEIWPTKQEEANSVTFGPGSTSNTIASAMKENDRIQSNDTPVTPSQPVLRKVLTWRLDQLSG